MKIKEIGVISTYQLGFTSNFRKYVVNADLFPDINEGDRDIKSNLKIIEDTIDEYFKEAHPDGRVVSVERIIKDDRTPQQKIIDSINTCNTQKAVESFKLLAEKNPEINEAYTNKLKEFNP